jgi:plastocyanin
VKKAIVIIILAIIIGGIAIAAKNNNNNSDNSSKTPQNTAPSSPSNTSNNTPAPPSSSASSVTIQNMTFTPASISVKKGTIVTWKNNDNLAHTVTADSGKGPNSSTVSPGDTYSFTFTKVGTFKYHCSIHPDMHGTVTVTE